MWRWFFDGGFGTMVFLALFWGVIWGGGAAWLRWETSALRGRWLHAKWRLIARARDRYRV